MNKIFAIAVAVMLLGACQKSEKSGSAQTPATETSNEPASVSDTIKQGEICLRISIAIINDVKQLAADSDDAQLQKLITKHPLPPYTKIETAEQAEYVQKSLEGFVVDLLELAETNENAKKITDKYQVRRGQ